MNTKVYLFAALAGTMISISANAQPVPDSSIRLEAMVQTAPPQVSLSWKKTPGATVYQISRKAKTATFWTPLSSTPDSFYVDAAVVSDSSYEYQVVGIGGTANRIGFLYAGINSPAIHNKGTMIVLVDTLFRDSCATAIQQLMQDLSGDGWALVRHDITRTLPDSMVKKIIKNDYSTRSDVKAVLIIGHIAVPYSGNLNPDAHPEHLGAWPADNYYADVDGIWTDAFVSNTSGTRTASHNVPGDGKWDQSGNPSPIDLQISRIDFANMPVFAKSEVTMMNSYLAKAHLFKTDSLYISKKAIVDDNFGWFGGEAFSANAWRNFSSLVGRANVFSGDFITTLNDSAYIWGYGCGAGSYTSCAGVGTTSNFVSKKQKGIFTMMFGSYFGDWDNTNNLLRAPLCCDEPALTSGWAGRPNWYVHHMSLGENIGLGKLLTDNNLSLYSPLGYLSTGVHVALLGDLSLRTQYIKPAAAVVISPIAKGAKIDWTASLDASVLGYYVYRSDSVFGTYKKISGMVTGTTFDDTVGISGLYYYMVRPAKLEQSFAGTYYNLGLGVRDSSSVTFPTNSIRSIVKNNARLVCFPNPTKNILNVYAELTNNSGIANVKILDLSGKTILEETHQYSNGEFTISMNCSNWATGLYFVQIADNERILSTSKFIKE